MKKITFDFLHTMEVKDIEKAPTSATTVEKTPAPGAHLRLFADGSIYPSKELVAAHHLEFQPKDSVKVANGYDVFVSTDWSQYNNTSPNAVPFVCLALTSKHMDKVDLFSQVRYEGNTPKSSVLNQKTAAGTALINALSKVYLDNPETESIFGNKSYVDLVIMINSPLHTSPTGIYHIPKVVERGKDAGKPTYTRRENAQIFPVAILEEAVEVAVEAPAKKTTAAAALFN
jgi:hypothetical protein